MDAPWAWFTNWLTTNINRSVGSSFQRRGCVAAGKREAVVCACSVWFGWRTDRGCVKCSTVRVKGSSVKLTPSHWPVATSSHHLQKLWGEATAATYRWSHWRKQGMCLYWGAGGWRRIFDTAACLTQLCRINSEWHLGIYRHEVATCLIVCVRVSFSGKHKAALTKFEPLLGATEHTTVTVFLGDISSEESGPSENSAHYGLFWVTRILIMERHVAVGNFQMLFFTALSYRWNM